MKKKKRLKKMIKKQETLALVTTIIESQVESTGEIHLSNNVAPGFMKIISESSELWGADLRKRIS